MIGKPEKAEYDPFFQKYIDHVIDKSDILQYIKVQNDDFLNFIKTVPLEKHNFAYASGKWTIKQLLRHIIDAERMFAFRAMSIARNEKSKLPGFDEDGYVREADDAENTYDQLVDEFELLRASNISMISNFSSSIQGRMGNANGSNISVRAIIYIIAGHLAHHTNIMSERYL